MCLRSPWHRDLTETATGIQGGISFLQVKPVKKNCEGVEMFKIVVFENDGLFLSELILRQLGYTH